MGVIILFVTGVYLDPKGRRRWEAVDSGPNLLAGEPAWELFGLE